MNTYSLSILLTVVATINGQPLEVINESSVIDQNLTISDCLAAWADIKPTYQQGEFVTVFVNPSCELER